MAAQTFVGAKAKASYPISSFIGAGVVSVGFASFTVPEAPEVGDIYQLFNLPTGAVPIGGYFACTDIDTGTETLDIDIGIAANGVDAADPDFFTNSGLLSGDAITDFAFTNAANVRLFTGTFPVQQLGGKTMVQAVVNAVSAAGTTGTIFVVVFYTMPGKTTS